MINRFRQANQGRKILHDWLGDGGLPVPIGDAQARANICAACPHNEKGSWIWNLATAAAIGSQLALRETMKIHLQNEGLLGVCNLCGCKLQLKVHTPFAHLYKHTSDEQFEKYPMNCWQRQEFEKMKGRQ